MLAALIKNTDDDETEDEKDALNNSLTAMDWLQQLNGKDVGQSSSDCENEDPTNDENNQPPYRSVKIREIISEASNKFCKKINIFPITSFSNYFVKSNVFFKGIPCTLISRNILQMKVEKREIHAHLKKNFVKSTF